MVRDGAGLRPDHIARALGVSRGAARRHISCAELRAAILKGLPYASLEALASRLHIARKDVVAPLRVPPRTLARRKRARRFDADESDLIRQAPRSLGSGPRRPPPIPSPGQGWAGKAGAGASVACGESFSDKRLRGSVD